MPKDPSEVETLLDLIEYGVEITLRVSNILRDTLIVTYSVDGEQCEETVLVDFERQGRQ